MAVIHLAFSFNAEQFHRRLEQQIVVDGRLRLDILHDLAIKVANSPSESTQYVLQLMCYDEDWLDDSDKEISRDDEWYLINLADILKPAPSLSNRFPSSHSVVRQVLPLIGWSKSDIHSLLLGKHLQVLLEASESKVFSGVFQPVGGFLGVGDAQALLSQLELDRGNFEPPRSDLCKAIEEFAGYNRQEPSVLIQMAYADALEMLATAVQRKEALYIIYP